MRRPWLLALVCCSCAAAPAAPSKMGWDEAGFSTPEAEENAAAPALTADELARRERLSPLAGSTRRFAGVERVLRTQPGQALPADARRAYLGLFAAIDQTCSGALEATPADLLRARLALAGELALDRDRYAALPADLDAEVRARLQALEQASTAHPAHSRPVALSWPLETVQISSLFGPRLDPLDPQQWKRHQGLDLAAEQGELVTAAAPGVVVEAGPRAGFGLLVAVRHPDGAITRYGHLSQLLTRQGLTLSRGGAVGQVGQTGRATGPHLHFELWRHGRAVDPLEELPDPQSARPRATLAHAR